MQWSIAHSHYASRILQQQIFSLLLNHIVLAYLMRARRESKVDPPYFDDAGSTGDDAEAPTASGQCGNSVRTQPGMSVTSWNFSLGMTTAMHAKFKRMGVNGENRVSSHMYDKAVRITLSFERVVKAQ